MAEMIRITFPLTAGRSRRAMAVAAAMAVLAGCAGNATDLNDSSGMSGTLGTTASGYQDAGMKPAMDGAGKTMPTAALPDWRAVVQSIEPMSRQEAGVGATGALGAAAAGGAVTGMGSDRVFRVTLRTEDGGTRSMVVDTLPDYAAGDRVKFVNGSLQRE